MPLFDECSKSDLAKVSRIADEVDVPEGKELIREGELARQFFILTDGWAEARCNGRKVNSMGPGDFFGEIGLVTDRVYVRERENDDPGECARHHARELQEPAAGFAQHPAEGAEGARAAGRRRLVLQRRAALVAFEREVDQPLQQVGIRDPGRLEEPRVHARRR